MNDARGSRAYTIIATLHRGSRHITYQAKNFFTSQPVVIKTAESQWKHDSNVNAGLKREAEICAQLDHPNIRRVQGIFEEDHVAYLVADFIDGKPLYEMLGSTRNAPDVEQMLAWLRELLDAMIYAHSLGVYHLCLDPSNVLVDNDNHAIIIGFGADNPSTELPKDVAPAFHPLLFTAPEEFFRDPSDGRADVYSLAAITYAMLCQRMPWSLDSRLGIEKQKEQSLTRPVLDPELLSRNIPRWLYTVLLKALMPNPDDRFPDAAAMLEALNAEQELHTTAGKPYKSPAKLPDPKPEVPPQPREHIPEPVPDIFPTSEVPVQIPSHEPPKPSTPVSTLPKPVSAPKRDDPVPSKPKTAQQSSLRRAWTSIVTEDPDTSADPVMARLRKTAVIMGAVSILVLLFVVGKYVIFRDRPVLDVLDEIEEEAPVEAAPRVANKAIRMVKVSGDSIVIGNISHGSEEDEFPTLRLKVPDFMISPYEITNQQWSMVYPDFYYPDGDEDKPVVNVSFLEVLDYCNAKSVKDGLDPCYVVGNNYSCDFNSNGYRLPTEAEWEFAAKYGQDAKYPVYSGSDHADDVAWHKGNSGGGLHPVGKKDKNALGLYDMSGNAYEWVWNWYASYAMSANPFEGPYTGTDRVIRGGSWYHDPKDARVTNRAFQKPFARAPYVGFRLVRSK